MAYHFIAIASVYSRGIRMGWHYAEENRLDKAKIQYFLDAFKAKCGEQVLGIHKIVTHSKDWASVIEKDSFFQDVIAIDKIDEFINYVAMDKELLAYDVAKFMLSIVPMTHLKLQKMLYLTYADFLVKTGKKLFGENIVTYKYGPVIEEVFHKFRTYGSTPIDLQEDARYALSTDQKIITPSFMKIIVSEHGVLAAENVLETIDRYASLSAYDLVEITHAKNGPWDRIYRLGRNSIISDKVIKNYHYLVQNKAHIFLQKQNLL